MSYRRNIVSVLVICLAIFVLAHSTAYSENNYDRGTRVAIDKGIDWLLRAQNENGSWGLDRGSPGDVTCTALASLALMARGDARDTVTRERISRAVRKATKFIASEPAWTFQADVTLVQRKLGTHIHTFMATIYISQVYGTMSTEEQVNFGITTRQLKRRIRYMSKFIAEHQEKDGSWHKDRFGSLKATGMAWLALRCSYSTGVQIKHASVDKTLAFIKRRFDPETGFFAPGGHVPSYQHIYATAAAIRVLYGMGEGKSKEAQEGTKALLKWLVDRGMLRVGQSFFSVEGEDYIAAMLITQALLYGDREHWQKWFPWLCQTLCKRQNYDGSWTSTACITGKTVPTASALLALQTPNQILPLQEL